jgi:hypothetical protein
LTGLRVGDADTVVESAMDEGSLVQARNPEPP